MPDFTGIPQKSRGHTGEETMTYKISRRSVVALGAASLATPFLARAGWAQDPVRIRFSAVFSEQDIRA